MAKKIELISLNDLIPPSISRDKNIQSIIGAVDPQLQEVSQSIREAFIISRINELPENVIDLLAWQWHVDFYEPDLPIETKRGLVLDSIRWHKKKGTKSAIKSALESLGFVPTFLEWFDIGTAPHTFEIYGHYRENDLNVFFLGPDTEEILTRVVEITKPTRSKLISLIIAPIPPDLKTHACYWDGCIWGHPATELHDWGLLPLPVFENDPVTGIDFVHGFNVISDIQLWDMSTWGGTPYRELRFCEDFERGIIVDLNREHTATWYIPYSWGKFTWGEAERYSLDFEFDFLRDASCIVDIKPLPFGTLYFVDMSASLQPYWDFYTWAQHGTWGETFGIPYVGSGFQRDNNASVQWESADAPYAKWSKFRTWGETTWEKEPTIAGTWETGAWIEDDEKEEAI